MTSLATLFGRRTFGSSLFGSGITSAALLDNLMVFDGFSLQRDDGIIVIEAYDDPMPTRELIGESVPRGHGMYLNGAYWRKASIKARGTLRCSSVSELLAYRDLMKHALSGTEKILDITDGGRTRRYIATLENPQGLFPKREHYNVDWLPWSASFECRTPFAIDRDYSTESLSIVSSPDSLGVIPAGTVESDGALVLVFDSTAGVTSVNVQRIRTSDGMVMEEIQYDGAIASGDVLIFDGELKKVLLNSSEVTYLGSHILLPGESSLLKVTFDGTAAITATAKWKNRYL